MESTKTARPRRDDAHKLLTENEIAALFDAIENPRDIAMFRLAYHRGLRASEIGKLQLADYRIRDGRLMVRRLKGSISAEFKLTEVEIKAIRNHLRGRGTEAGPLFLSRNHRAISRYTLDDLMKKYCEAAGITREKAHMHALKHSCGTHLLERGESIEDVQDQLGHRNIQNTQIYARMGNKRRDDRADRLRDWR